MTWDNQVRSDIQYVRETVEGSKAFPPMAPAILYMWAAIVLSGFVLMDFGQNWFWPIGGIVGGAISIVVSRRMAHRRGQVDSASALRVNLHWAVGLAGGLILIIPLQISGSIDAATNGQIALLVITICYFMAGLHLDRFMMWLSVLAAIGYGSTFFLDSFAWTVPGVAIAAGLFAVAIRQHLAVE